MLKKTKIASKYLQTHVFLARLDSIALGIKVPIINKGGGMEFGVKSDQAGALVSNYFVR